jgi:hypothetical protein
VYIAGRESARKQEVLHHGSGYRGGKPKTEPSPELVAAKQFQVGMIAAGKIKKWKGWCKTSVGRKPKTGNKSSESAAMSEEFVGEALQPIPVTIRHTHRKQETANVW